MRYIKLGAVVLILLLLASVPRSPVSAIQSPTITVSFSCTPSGAACTEYLRLASESLGYNAGSGLTRMQWVQRDVLRRLHELAKSQNRAEAINTAGNTADTNFNSAYTVP